MNEAIGAVMMLRISLLVCVSMVVVACSQASPAPQRYCRVTDGDQISPSDARHWIDAAASIYELANAGRCGDELPVIENSTLFTPSCGLSADEMTGRLETLGHTGWRVTEIGRGDYQLAFERNERMIVRTPMGDGH